MTKFSPHPQAFWGVMSLLWEEEMFNVQWSPIPEPRHEIVWLLWSRYRHLFWEKDFQLNISQNSKYVSEPNLISQCLQDRWFHFHERAFSEKLSAKNAATFSQLRSPLSFVYFCLFSEQLSWQSFWPKVLMLLKRSLHPICLQIHIQSHCRFPTLLFPLLSPERKDIETHIKGLFAVYLLDWTSLNRGDGSRFSSTKVNCPLRMSSLLHLQHK